MVDIQYIGVNELKDNEKEIVDALSVKHSERIERSLDGITSFRVHLKVYEKEGNRNKFSITIHIVGKGKVFRSSASGWDLPKALHQSYLDIEKQIEHMFHAK